MKTQYINKNLIPALDKAKTLQQLRKTGKLSLEQQEDLLNLSDFLIFSLVNDFAKLKKQNIVLDLNKKL
jgi:hypothetical protein